MNNNGIKTIAIAGGSTAGWTVAAALSQGLQARGVQILVLQSDQDTPGAVAETTLPSSTAFQRLHGMDERDLMRGTRASFRLGSEYLDWWGTGQAHFGSLGSHGAGIGFMHFQHYYTKARTQGAEHPFNDYSMNAVASRLGKFSHPLRDPSQPLSTLVYGHHLDNAWYRLYLRGFAEYHGARCVEGELADVLLQPDNGFIRALKLADGQQLEADLFIDCTGRQARLIGQSLQVPFEDWSHWLPSDSVVSINRPPELDPAPCTRVRACAEGFIRDIPLQDRVVRELHYRSGLTDDQAALAALRACSPDAGGGAAVLQRTRHGRHERAWQGNCIAIGAAAGSVEALAMGELYFAETMALKLLDLFPDTSCPPVLADEFNRLAALRFEHARDFNALHYQADTLPGGPFWAHAQAVPPPPGVANRIALFEGLGELTAEDEETYTITHWVSLMLGQGRLPQAYNSALDNFDWEQLQARFTSMREAIKASAKQMPKQRDYLLQYLRPAQSQ